MSPGDTVQNGTGKIDTARKLKCTTRAARDNVKRLIITFKNFHIGYSEKVLYCTHAVLLQAKALTLGCKDIWLRKLEFE